MALTWPTKDEDEVLDYVLDWSNRLASGDTITTSTWIVEAGIDKDSDSKTDSTTTIWLSGGTDGVTYTLTNRVVTAGGRTMDQSVDLPVATK